MTVRWKPLTRSRSQRTDKSYWPCSLAITAFVFNIVLLWYQVAVKIIGAIGTEVMSFVEQKLNLVSSAILTRSRFYTRLHSVTEYDLDIIQCTLSNPYPRKTGTVVNRCPVTPTVIAPLLAPDCMPRRHLSATPSDNERAYPTKQLGHDDGCQMASWNCLITGQWNDAQIHDRVYSFTAMLALSSS